MTDPTQAFREYFFGAEGPGGRPEVRHALARARGILSRHVREGRVAFKSPSELDAAFKADHLRLVVNEPFGPPLPDARQLIYASADGCVLVKVKTRGYANGGRAGGTMSVELGDGHGTGWQHVVCKVDHAGEPIPSNVITPEQLHRTAVGLHVRRASGRVEPVMPHEVVLDDAAGFDASAFADRGHFDLGPAFDPAGAAGLQPSVGTR